MRNLILSAALGLGALGLMGATPSEAKAQRINPLLVQRYNVGPYGYMNAYTLPAWRYQQNLLAARYSYYTPAWYQTRVTPFSVQQYWATRGMVGWTYNPWYGLNYTTVTPAIWGYSYSPYYNYFRPVRIPSMTYTVPAGYVLP